MSRQYRELSFHRQGALFQNDGLRTSEKLLSWITKHRNLNYCQWTMVLKSMEQLLIIWKETHSRVLLSRSSHLKSFPSSLSIFYYLTAHHWTFLLLPGILQGRGFFVHSVPTQPFLVGVLFVLPEVHLPDRCFDHRHHHHCHAGVIELMFNWANLWKCAERLGCKSEISWFISAMDSLSVLRQATPSQPQLHSFNKGNIYLTRLLQKLQQNKTCETLRKCYMNLL